MAYHNILVSYDGSEQSIRALKTGIEMAATWQAKLSVIHVYDIPVVIVGEAMIQPSVENSVAIAQEADTIAEEARSIITSIVGDASQHIEVDVLQGDPGRKIIETASENKIDLIVLGSRGLGGFKELFLGSVSHYVIQHATVPVHVVK
ncbi:universal stress protein [Paenibacillaceae bacterium]|nr:universal stress protein [Paenibacillaceae bacterium]